VINLKTAKTLGLTTGNRAGSDQGQMTNAESVV
jgi:hypothetical protein